MLNTLVTTTLVFVLCFVTAPLYACDNNDECGVGGTCIKREKRARGVCYGGERSTEPTTPAPKIHYQDPLSAPTDRPTDACMVTQECPAGMECVIAGVWGKCMVL